MPVSKKILAERYREYDRNQLDTMAAFEIFKIYQKLRGFRIFDDIHDFIKITSYAHYLKLAAFVKRVHIPNIEVYLKAMIHNQRPQTTWTNNLSYRRYLEYIDELQPPIEAIESTINEFFDIAEKVDMPVNQLVNDLQLTEIMLLLRQRRISPWIVLHSSVIKNKIVTADKELQKEFLTMFDLDTWKIKFSQDPVAVSIAKQAVEELEI